MSYSVKEIFYTLQGEGANAGRPAVFLRFAGCNLWSGLERDRATAVCQFCDTEFVGTDGDGGGRFPSADALAESVASKWPAFPTPSTAVDFESKIQNPRSQIGSPLVVCTGGEPLLQLDPSAIAALHEKGFEIAIESNGTLPAPAGIDWICVSPKAGTECVLRRGHELKLVFPQPALPPESCAGWDFEYFFLQPMDGPQRDQNTRLALEYCLAHPQWRLSLQTHKLLGIR